MAIRIGNTTVGIQSTSASEPTLTFDNMSSGSFNNTAIYIGTANASYQSDETTFWALLDNTGSYQAIQSNTWVTVADVNGPGKFFGIVGPESSSTTTLFLKVTIDGKLYEKELAITSVGYRGIMGDFPVPDSATSVVIPNVLMSSKYVYGIPFNTSLKVEMSQPSIRNTNQDPYGGAIFTTIN